MACLFCRERKIACGAPPVGSADTTCNQCARRSRKCEYPTRRRHKRRDNGVDHAPYTKEDQEQLHVGTSMPRASTLLHGHGSLHHGQYTLDSFRLVQDLAAYPGFSSSADSARRNLLPPSLSIPGPNSYSPGGRIPSLSSSFSSSDADAGMPTSSVNLMDNTATSSSLPTPTLVLNRKAGQGVLKLPKTERSTRRKSAIACLFCRERKVACGAPPAGSADSTCNQCAQRSRKCEYPTMSQRGLHKHRDNGGGHHRESDESEVAECDIFGSRFLLEQNVTMKRISGCIDVDVRPGKPLGEVLEAKRCQCWTIGAEDVDWSRRTLLPLPQDTKGKNEEGVVELSWLNFV
ncbi:hypothetical protein DFH94DRAFT_846064 [Russula ochroleuca]|uniref:Zn(2)-C6 fungal-type domain-containing protein n=1 Tax=Russula ochroleuca TaxID=152965 RepID=A0A9P5T5Y4_9AGAM|nr:hypothetical protein DFH94DRAFT_846064 [Russula ochroleuca]